MIKKILKFLNKKSLILILFVAFVLRFYRIEERFYWGIEQSASIWPIARLFEEKKLTLIGQHVLASKFALFMAPFYIYIFALPLKIFNFNPLALEIIFAGLGIVVTAFIYFTAKKIFSQNTAILSSLIYAVSFNIINSDKNIWVITPIILTSALILFFITKLAPKGQNFYIFIIGSLAGLGFSFHYQAIIITTALLLIIIKFFSIKKTVFLLIGLILLVSPLILYNFRHNFITINGVANIFLAKGNIARKGQSVFTKLQNGFITFTDLSSQILNISLKQESLLINFIIFFLLFIFPGLYIYKKSQLKIQKLFSLYYLFLIISALLGLMIVNPPGYPTTSFYLLFLIPILIIIWTHYLQLIFKKRLILLILLVFIYSLINFKLIINQGPGNYQKTTSIVTYILGNVQNKKTKVKFIGKDVLSYDYLFYYQARFYGRKGGNLSLLEEWSEETKPDFYVIQGNYNWQENKYNIKDYQKIISFDDVKIIIM